MFKTIKDILRKNKNACIIVVENEKPLLVVSSFEEYQRMSDSSAKSGQNEGFASARKDALSVAKEDPLSASLAKREDDFDLNAINEETIGLQDLGGKDVEIGGIGGDKVPSGVRIEDIPLV